MADNTTLNLGSGGDVIATDDIGGVKHQYVKVEFGAADTATPVSAVNPLPVVQTGTLNVGTVTTVSAVTAISNALPAGNNNIGDVDIVTMPNVTLAAGTNTNEVVGDAAHDAAAAGNPVLLGAYASAAAPTDVSADADVARLWALRSGALAVQPTMGGVLAVAGNGASGTGVQRVTIANDSTGILAGVTTVATVTNVATIGTSVTPGTAAANLGKAEDAVHTSGDVGVMMLGVQKSADAALAADGDYVPPQFDSNGYLKVNIKAGAGSGGTAMTDAAAFTRATTSVTPIAGVVETSAPTLTNGNAGALSLTTGGAVRVAVASGGITGLVEDAASAGGEEGIGIVVVRRDTPSSGVSADGDFAMLSCNSTGALYVTGGGGGTQYAVDTAAGGTDTGTLSLAVRDDALATLTPVDNDYTQFRTNARGALWVALDSTAAQTVTLAAGTATNEIVGDVAHDGVAAGNPVLIGARASAAAPTDVSADNDVTELWALRSGALATQDTYAGVLAVAGNGASGTGVQRVTIANDSTGVLATVTNVATIGTSVTPGTAAANLGKAEDAVHASGDTGVMVLAVRQDTQATLASATGDYVPFTSDSVGSLYTRNANEIADDAAFTVGTSRVQPVGYMADETSTDSVDEGDVGIARMTLDRKLIVAPAAHTAGGATPVSTVSAASTNATSLKASAGQVYSVTVSSVNAAMRYLKFYNKASAPTVGTDTPVYVFPIPGNTAGAGVTHNFPSGLEFTTGIAWALTTGAAVADTGAVAASEHIVSIGYK